MFLSRANCERSISLLMDTTAIRQSPPNQSIHSVYQRELWPIRQLHPNTARRAFTHKSTLVLHCLTAAYMSKMEWNLFHVHINVNFSSVRVWEVTFAGVVIHSFSLALMVWCRAMGGERGGQALPRSGGWCVCVCVCVCTQFSPHCSSHQQSLLKPAAFSNKEWLPITAACPLSLSLSLSHTHSLTHSLFPSSLPVSCFQCLAFPLAGHHASLCLSVLNIYLLQPINVISTCLSAACGSKNSFPLKTRF